MPTDTTRTGSEQPAGAPRAYDAGDVEAGLDALQSQTSRTASLTSRLRRSVLPPVIAVALLLAVWQLVVELEVKPEFVLPSPAGVWGAFLELWSDGDAQRAVLTSLERGVVGFLVAVLVGTPLGLLISRVPLVRTAIGPLVTGLQVLPSVAWVPFGILWFGLSDATVYFVILMGAVPSIANGIVAGVDQIPPLYHRVGQVLGAGRWDMVRHIVLPAALPGYLAGLKQGWAFAWRSLMAAEIIAVGGDIGFGMGALLQQGRELFRIDIATVAILLILIVGIAIELLFFAPLERRVLRSRGLTARTS
jgi:NitT/TauT family transport system permease protein